MNILRLRTVKACHEFKTQQQFNADERTRIVMLPCGHFVVTVGDKSVLFPGAAVEWVLVDAAPEVKKVK